MPLFIALEGIDGSGTTTQASMLAEWFEDAGLAVLLTREPSSGPVGKMIREILTQPGNTQQQDLDAHRLALLFAADRLSHLGNEILPALEQNRHVISDRYLLSSLAYQSIHCSPEWVGMINCEARPPDLTLLLDLPIETAMQRVQARGQTLEIYERPELQRKIRERYLDQAREVYAEQSIIIIDATASADQVSRLIIKEVKRKMEVLIE